MTGHIYRHVGGVWSNIFDPTTPPPPPPPYWPPFTLGETKPGPSNVGAGLLRPVTGSYSGDLTITTPGTVLKDTYIHGRLSIQAAGVYVENCIIEGPATDPGSSGTIFVVNANNAACAAGPAEFAYCTIRGAWSRPSLNGCGNRNIYVHQCDISQVVDGFDPAGTTTDTNARMRVHGNWIHDFIFYAGADAGHAATPRTSIGGQTMIGPAFALDVGWTHCDGVQVEPDTVTGVEVIGNSITATWSANPAVSMLPLPYDAAGNTVIKELSCFMLNGGRNLTIDQNWLDGGEECINNADTAVTGTIQRNRFGRGMAHTGTADSTYYAIVLTAAGLNSHDSDGSLRNVWADSGATVNRR